MPLIAPYMLEVFSSTFSICFSRCFQMRAMARYKRAGEFETREFHEAFEANHIGYVWYLMALIALGAVVGLFFYGRWIMTLTRPGAHQAAQPVTDARRHSDPVVAVPAGDQLIAPFLFDDPGDAFRDAVGQGAE